MSNMQLYPNIYLDNQKQVNRQFALTHQNSQLNTLPLEARVVQKQPSLISSRKLYPPSQMQESDLDSEINQTDFKGKEDADQAINEYRLSKDLQKTFGSRHLSVPTQSRNAFQPLRHIVPNSRIGGGHVTFNTKEELNPFYTAAFDGSRRDQIRFTRTEKEKQQNLLDQHSWKLKKHGMQFKANLMARFKKDVEILQNGYVSDNKKYNRKEFGSRTKHSPSPERYQTMQSTLKSTTKVQIKGTGAAPQLKPIMNNYSGKSKSKLLTDLLRSQGKFPIHHQHLRNNSDRKTVEPLPRSIQLMSQAARQSNASLELQRESTKNKYGAFSQTSPSREVGQESEASAAYGGNEPTLGTCKIRPSRLNLATEKQNGLSQDQSGLKTLSSFANQQLREGLTYADPETLENIVTSISSSKPFGSPIDVEKYKDQYKKISDHNKLINFSTSPSRNASSFLHSFQTDTNQTINKIQKQKFHPVKPKHEYWVQPMSQEQEYDQFILRQVDGVVQQSAEVVLPQVGRNVSMDNSFQLKL